MKLATLFLSLTLLASMLGSKAMAVTTTATSSDPFADLKKAIEKDSGGVKPTSANSTIGSEPATTGDICQPGNQVSLGMLKLLADVDNMEINLLEDDPKEFSSKNKKAKPDLKKKDLKDEFLRVKFKVKHHKCFCPAVRAFKQDDKVYLVVENVIFQQNKDWTNQQTGNKSNAQDLYLACLNDKNASLKCDNRTTQDGDTLLFDKVKIEAGKDAKKFKEVNKDKDKGPALLTGAQKKSTPIFYLTNESFISGSETYDRDYKEFIATQEGDIDPAFDVGKFSGNGANCTNYRVENLPADKKNKKDDSDYRWLTLSPEDQYKAIADCEDGCGKDFYNLHKNDHEFLSLLNDKMSEIFNKLGDNNLDEIEKALKEIKSCKNEEGRDDARDAAKEAIKKMEAYERDVLDPLWKDLKDQRKKVAKATGDEKKKINERIKKLQEVLGKLDKLSVMNKAIANLAKCDLTSEGERIADIRNKSYYYAHTKKDLTDEQLQKKLDNDRKKFNRYADEEKKEYLARTGEKTYSSDFLYRSKAYTQKANLATLEQQQMLIEMNQACATSIFGFQTNPARCSTLQKNYANAVKKGSIYQNYYNTLATKEQDKASSFLKIEAEGRAERKEEKGLDSSTPIEQLKKGVSDSKGNDTLNLMKLQLN